MKSAIIMLAIVAIVIAANMAVGGFVERGTEELLPYVEAAQAALKGGDADEAARQVDMLKERWDAKERVWEAFIDHNDSEHMETMLMRLKAMDEADTPELMLPELREMEFFLSHLTEKQKLMLENIF